LTHAELFNWITDDESIGTASLSSFSAAQSHMNSALEPWQGALYFSSALYMQSQTSTGNIVGKSIRNPLALGTVLRLIRFLGNDFKDQWLSDFLALTQANRKCVSVLAALPEWQPCLFSILSETLELANGRRSFDAEKNESSTDPVVLKRLDICLHLYSVLLGHLVRSGGDRVSHSLGVVPNKLAWKYDGGSMMLSCRDLGSSRKCRAMCCALCAARHHGGRLRSVYFEI
jgi:hypothetical protein